MVSSFDQGIRLLTSRETIIGHINDEIIWTGLMIEKGILTGPQKLTSVSLVLLLTVNLVVM